MARLGIDRSQNLSLWDAPRVPPTRVLHSGRTVESRQASLEAGQRAHASGSADTQCARMLQVYRDHGDYGVTDAEMAGYAEIRRYVVPGRRAELAREHSFTTAGRRDGSTVFVIGRPR